MQQRSLRRTSLFVWWWPLLAGVALASLVSGCAWLRPTLGLCHASITSNMRTEEKAAQEFTDASFSAALQQQGLTRLFPEYEEVHSSDDRGPEPGLFEYRISELIELAPEEGPAFARDEHGVVHLLVREPTYVWSRRYEQCACRSGYDKGITPGDIVRRYRVGELGPNVPVRYDARAVTFPQPTCQRAGPPKV